MERSEPIHWTLFMWIGPVPAEGGGDMVDLKTMLQKPKGHGHNLVAIFLVLCLCPPNTDTMRLADFITQRSTHTRLRVSFQMFFLHLIFKPTMKCCHDKMLLQAKQKNHLPPSTLGICHTSLPPFCCFRHNNNNTACSAPPWVNKQDQICINKRERLSLVFVCSLKPDNL